jgi:predicted component of type VI protein secretion system
MPYLTLRFGQSILKDYALRGEPVTIGRSPQATIFIDNPAVSHQHARVMMQDDRYFLQDLGSTNGTFHNGVRVAETLVELREGDTIDVGKHNLRYWLKPSMDAAANPWGTPARTGAPPAEAPKLEGTMILDTKRRRELADMLAAKGGAAGAATKKRVGKLVVLRGKTSAREYVLSSGIAIIGKSENATVKLMGWFAAPIAGMLNRKGEGYVLSPAGKKKMKVNGDAVTTPRELRDGDVLSAGRVQMQFTLVDW